MINLKKSYRTASQFRMTQNSHFFFQHFKTHTFFSYWYKCYGCTLPLPHGYTAPVLLVHIQLLNVILRLPQTTSHWMLIPAITISTSFRRLAYKSRSVLFFKMTQMFGWLKTFDPREEKKLVKKRKNSIDQTMFYDSSFILNLVGWVKSQPKLQTCISSIILLLTQHVRFNKNIDLKKKINPSLLARKNPSKIVSYPGSDPRSKKNIYI